MWPAIIGAVAGLLGGGMQQSSAKAAAQKQQDFQQQTLDTSREWNAQQSGSAHQREVADLRAAGLNPILSGTGGMGSASPSASGMSGSTYQPQNIGEAAFSSAIAARRNVEEVKLLRQQQRKTGHEADEAESNAAITDYERRVRDFQRHLGDKDNNNVGGIEAEARRRYEEDRAGSTASALERSLDESSGELMRTLKRLGITGSTATQLFQLIQGRKGSYPADRPFPRRGR